MRNFKVLGEYIFIAISKIFTLQNNLWSLPSRIRLCCRELPRVVGLTPRSRTFCPSPAADLRALSGRLTFFLTLLRNVSSEVLALTAPLGESSLDDLGDNDQRMRQFEALSVSLKLRKSFVVLSRALSGWLATTIATLTRPESLSLSLSLSLSSER